MNKYSEHHFCKGNILVNVRRVTVSGGIKDVKVGRDEEN